MRGKQNLFGMAPFFEGDEGQGDNWSEEDELWESYKEKQKKMQRKNSGASSFERSENSLNLH